MEAQAQSPTLEESRIVERIASIFSSVRGEKPDYTRLAAELEPAIPFDLMGIVLLNHDRKAVRVTICQRQNTGQWIAKHHQHPVSDSKLEQFLAPQASGSIEEPAISGSSQLQIESYPQGLDGPPTRSGDALSGHHYLRATLIAPLIVDNGHVLGTLELGSTNINAYSDAALLRHISAVTHVLATAIESAQAGGSAEIQNRQRQALKDVSSSLASKMELPAIFNQIVHGIAQALNVSAMLVTYDLHEKYLRLEAHVGFDPEALKNVFGNQQHLEEKTITSFTLLHREAYLSQDISIDERFPDSRSFGSSLGIRTVYSYPLISGSTVYGALLVCSPEAGGFTPLKTDILSLFVNQAVIAIHNGKLIESAQQRSNFQRAIEQFEHMAVTPRQEASLEDELALLKRVRDETEKTFGISFSSLMHFISKHLLTRDERDLQAIFDSQPTQSHSKELEFLYRGEEPESIDLLTNTAKEALERVGIYSELIRLVQLYEQGTGDRKDAWLVVDLQGRCIYMNPAAEFFFDRRLNDAQDRPLGSLFAPLFSRIRNLDEVRLYLNDIFQDNHNRQYKQEIHCIMGTDAIQRQKPAAQFTTKERRPPLLLDSATSDYHYQFTRYALNATNQREGEPVAIALRISDITEHVRDEKNKSALLSSVSHDLRTPLTVIKAAVTGLLQEDVFWDEENRRLCLKDIDSETDHLTVLVNAIVDLSRIEMGALVLEKKWCDIVEIANSTIDRLDRVLAGRPVRTLFQKHLPLIYADHVQLGRVFYNLIENAVRHSPEHAEIIITLDVIDERTLRAQVIDHGPGVPESEREHIFLSFYGLSSQGSGLGLAICKGIIEAHRGNISVETASHEGGGSCFVFTLPLHNAYTHTAEHMLGIQPPEVLVWSNRTIESPSNNDQEELL